MHSNTNSVACFEELSIEYYARGICPWIKYNMHVKDCVVMLTFPCDCKPFIFVVTVERLKNHMAL